MELRREFHHWIARNEEVLLDTVGPTYFLDGDGVPLRFFGCYRNNAKKFKGWKQRHKKLTEFYYKLEKLYHPGYMLQLKEGQHLHSHFWADSSVHLPLFALFTGVSIVLYTRKFGVCLTQLYEFRSDLGLVQIHQDVEGYVPPIQHAVVLHYNGVDHYEAVDLHENIRYSPYPAPADYTAEESVDEQVPSQG
jgi:hypothetical protein